MYLQKKNLALTTKDFQMKKIKWLVCSQIQGSLALALSVCIYIPTTQPAWSLITMVMIEGRLKSTTKYLVLCLLK